MEDHPTVLHGLKSDFPSPRIVMHLGGGVSNNSKLSNKSCCVNTVLPQPEEPTIEILDGV